MTVELDQEQNVCIFISFFTSLNKTEGCAVQKKLHFVLFCAEQSTFLSIHIQFRTPAHGANRTSVSYLWPLNKTIQVSCTTSKSATESAEWTLLTISGRTPISRTVKPLLLFITSSPIICMHLYLAFCW